MKEFREKSSQRSALSTQPFEKNLKKELQELRKGGLLRTTVCVQPSRNTHVVIAGESYVNLSSNDYLNLSSHPDIVKTAVTALNKYGFGSGASRLLSGTCRPHEELEKKIAQFKGTEAALVFNTGYAANTGVIPALAGTGDIIYSDELNHASIVDGTRLSKADVKVYRHRDVSHLETLLKESRGSRAGKRIVVTDTVFSMDGDIAPLNDIAGLCNRYGAMFMVDDAHGTGVLGKTGRGGHEHFGMNGGPIIQMGTLSKAAGCYGAFIAAEKDVIDLLINRARSFIYSTSLPPAVCAAGVKAIGIIESRSARLRKKLWKNRKRLYEGIVNLGFDTFNSETPIIPIMAGDRKKALKLAGHLYKHKIYAPAIRPPTVPEGKCRIRFSVTAGHRDEDIDRVLEVLKRVR